MKNRRPSVVDLLISLVSPLLHIPQPPNTAHKLWTLLQHNHNLNGWTTLTL